MPLLLKEGSEGEFRKAYKMNIIWHSIPYFEYQQNIKLCPERPEMLTPQPRYRNCHKIWLLSVSRERRRQSDLASWAPPDLTTRRGAAHRRRRRLLWRINNISSASCRMFWRVIMSFSTIDKIHMKLLIWSCFDRQWYAYAGLYDAMF